MEISVAGNGVMNKPEICMRWRGGAVAGSETEEFKQRFPVRVKSGDSFVGWVNTPIYESVVSDLDLRLHVMPENQEEVDVICRKILNPRTFPSLGRHEDLIRIDDVQVVDVLPAQEMTLDMCTYAPATAETPGTVYTIHKDYVIKNGKRRFNDIPVKYLDRGMKVIADCDNLNNPCFFI
jgi:CRISPR-associated protein Cas5t